MNKEKVIVTGSCGFIGHHMVRVLQEFGYHVVGIDNMSTGKKEWQSLPDEFIKVDIGDIGLADLRGAKWVFHMAALARVPFSIEQPAISNNANVTGTLKMLIKA